MDPHEAPATDTRRRTIYVLALLGLRDLSLPAHSKTDSLARLVRDTTCLQLHKLQLAYGHADPDGHDTAPSSSSSARLAALQQHEHAWAHLRFRPPTTLTLRPGLAERRPVLARDALFGMRFEHTDTHFVRLDLPSGHVQPNWISFRAPTDDCVVQFVCDPAQDLFLSVQQNSLG